jgi:hypothetical protein
MTRAAVAIVVLVAACHPPAQHRIAVENRWIDDEVNPNEPITEESLAQFLSWRFKARLDEGTFAAEYNETQDDVIDELHTMGIRTIHDFAAIIPDDFDERGAGEFIIEDPANIPGLVRDFMMINDADRYFQHAWKNKWQSILPANVSALKGYVRDFEPFYDAGVLTPQEVQQAAAPSADTDKPIPRLPQPPIN